MKNRDVAQAYLDAFSTGEADSVASFVTDDFRNIQVGLLGTGCTGAANYRERLAGFLAAFKNLKYDVQDLIVDGDKVAATYAMTFDDGTRRIEIEGVMVMTIRDGRIALRKDYWDGLSHIKQTMAGL